LRQQQQQQLLVPKLKQLVLPVVQLILQLPLIQQLLLLVITISSKIEYDF
jgi:hypothetical protein